MSKVKSILFAQQTNSSTFGLHAQLANDFMYPIVHCKESRQVWEQFKKINCLICIIDLNIIHSSSFNLMKKIRSKSDLVPIVLLSEPSSAQVRIEAYINGADGFLEYPFNPELLVLYVKAFLNRLPSIRGGKVFNISGKTFSLPLKTITNADNKILIKLPPRVAEILAFFLDNAGKTVRREEVLYNVWGKNDPFNGRSMDVVIRQLRNFLDVIDGGELETIHGVGFKFKMPIPIKEIQGILTAV